MKNSCVYKAINTYQQVSCFPLSVNIKQKNLSLQSKVYAVGLYRVLQELDTVPPFFYYKILLLYINIQYNYVMKNLHEQQLITKEGIHTYVQQIHFYV